MTNRRSQDLERLVEFLAANDRDLTQAEIQDDLRTVGITDKDVAGLVANALAAVAASKRAELKRARERIDARHGSTEWRSRVPAALSREEIIARLEARPNVEAYFRNKFAAETPTEELRSLLEDYLAEDEGEDDE